MYPSILHRQHSLYFFFDAASCYFLCSVYYFCRNTNALPHWISFFVSVAYLDMIHNEGGYVILLGNSWKSLLIAATITKTEYEAEMQSKIRGQRQFVIHILMCHAKYTLKGLTASFSIRNPSLNESNFIYQIYSLVESFMSFRRTP